MLTDLQLQVLERLKPYLRGGDVFLGGGTALTLKYSHRPSYDLDFFTWNKKREEFYNEVFRALSGFSRIVVEPVETILQRIKKNCPDIYKLL